MYNTVKTLAGMRNDSPLSCKPLRPYAMPQLRTRTHALRVPKMIPVCTKCASSIQLHWITNI